MDGAAPFWIDGRIADNTFETYVGADTPGNIKKLRAYVAEFQNHKNHSLLFVGINSCQKTTLALIVARELAKKGYRVDFRLFDTLVRDLTRQGFEEVNIPTECDLLVIDDAFDTSKATMYKSGYQLAFIDSFLRHRFEVLGKATIITTNKKLSEIGEVYGESLFALLRRNCHRMVFLDSVNGTRYAIDDIFAKGSSKESELLYD